MKIFVLNGSPHVNGATVHMVNAFCEGAKEAGHITEVISVAHKKIGGCLGCEYCHGKGNGECVQKDDMGEICRAILSSDMIVFATPIYYFGFSAQLQAAIHRTYSFGIPHNVKKVALILSSGDSDVYEAAIYEYKRSFVEYWGSEDAGVFTAHGLENRSEEKQKELYEFGKRL